MPTILTKRSNTPGAIPATANLTNAAGGAELAVNTADKRLFTITSGSQVVELGTNPGSLTCADASFTVARIGSGTVTQLTSTSATITTLTATSASVTNLTATSLVLSNLSIASANITTLTSSSATISTTLALSGGTANGVLYLNGSKVATSGSALTFDGTILGNALTANATYSEMLRLQNNGVGDGTGAKLSFNFSGTERGYVGTTYSSGWITDLNGTDATRFLLNSSEQMRLTSTGLGIGTSSPSAPLTVNKTGWAYSGNAYLTGVFVDGSGNKGVALGYDNTSQTGIIYPFTTSAASSLSFWTYPGSGSVTERMRLDSSGNLGLGVTPSAWASTAKAIQIKSYSSVFESVVGRTSIAFNAYEASSGSYKYLQNEFASSYQQVSGAHYWYTAPSGTAGNAISFTQAMTLDASGNLQLGGTTNKTTGVGGGGTGFTVQAAAAPTVAIWDTTDTSYYTNFTQINEVSYIWNIANGAMIFGTNNTERARITSGGYSKFSNAGTYNDSAGSYHEFRSNTSGQLIAYIQHTTATSPFGIEIDYTAADPNGTGNSFFACYGQANLRAGIRSNGGLANYQANNVDLSDARTKKDITPAASMWGKISALEIVTYKYNDQTHDDVNLGVIAQQVEAVDPVWVDNDGFGETPEGEEPLKTVYTKDIYFAAIKALQEAMARIEKLEAEVAALKGA